MERLKAVRTSEKIFLASLIIVDRLFATNFVERDIARRKAKVAHYEALVVELHEQLVRLEGMLEAANVQLCLLYLRQREFLLPDGWLRFDPGNPQEDKGLGFLIEHLVKPRLAAIEVREVEKGHYTYQLGPDWAAISGFLAQREPDLQPGIAEWLDEEKGF